MPARRGVGFVQFLNDFRSVSERGHLRFLRLAKRKDMRGDDFEARAVLAGFLVNADLAGALHG